MASAARWSSSGAARIALGASLGVALERLGCLSKLVIEQPEEKSPQKTEGQPGPGLSPLFIFLNSDGSINRVEGL